MNVSSSSNTRHQWEKQEILELSRRSTAAAFHLLKGLSSSARVSSTRQVVLCVKKRLVWNIYSIYTSLKILQTLKVHFRNIARNFRDTFFYPSRWVGGGEHARAFHARGKTEKQH